MFKRLNAWLLQKGEERQWLEKGRRAAPTGPSPTPPPPIMPAREDGSRFAYLPYTDRIGQPPGPLVNLFDKMHEENACGN